MIIHNQHIIYGIRFQRPNHCKRDKIRNLFDLFAQNEEKRECYLHNLLFWLKTNDKGHVTGFLYNL